MSEPPARSAATPPLLTAAARLWHALALALALRVLCFPLPHSGGSGLRVRAAAPLGGDFEAQRHWIEVTRHLPLREWYAQTPRNDLAYWGLDYP